MRKKGNMFWNSAPECLICFLEKVLSLDNYLKIEKNLRGNGNLGL